MARTGKDWTFNGSAHLDEKGFPHIALNIGKDLGTNTGGPKQTHYFRWDGKKWFDGIPVEITSSQNNTDTRGDFFIDKASGKVTFVLGYQEDKDGVIALFSNEDNNQSFVKKQELLRRPGASWAVTSTIHNAHPDGRIIVAEKIKGQQWHRMYLLGDGGAIYRDQ